MPPVLMQMCKKCVCCILWSYGVWVCECERQNVGCGGMSVWGMSVWDRMFLTSWVSLEMCIYFGGAGLRKGAEWFEIEGDKILFVPLLQDLYSCLLPDPCSFSSQPRNNSNPFTSSPVPLTWPPLLTSHWSMKASSLAFTVTTQVALLLLLGACSTGAWFPPQSRHFHWSC